MEEEPFFGFSFCVQGYEAFIKYMSDKVRVLMFGWEFPPFNSGGLGTACHGLSKALSEEGVEVTFVLPRKMDITCDFMRIIYATDILSRPESLKQLITYTTSDLYKIAGIKNYSHFNSLMQEVEYYGLVAELI